MLRGWIGQHTSDLSPIEHAWGDLGRRFRSNHAPIQQVGTVGPEACGRVASNITEPLPKTGEQHETEVYRVP